MKSKDIRKENARKKAPIITNGVKVIDVTEDGYTYHISHDQYNAIVSRPDTGEIVGIYRAAKRNWKKGQGFVSNNVRNLVESLYA